MQYIQLATCMPIHAMLQMMLQNASIASCLKLCYYMLYINAIINVSGYVYCELTAFNTVCEYVNCISLTKQLFGCLEAIAS